MAVVAMNEPTAVERGSLVDSMARRYVVPLALLLDVLALVIRVTQASLQVILPGVFALWNTHAGAALSAIYYTVNVTVIVAMAVGVTASAYLAFPLLALINQKIDSAAHIRKARLRREKLALLREKRKRALIYIALACVVPVLFGVSYVLAGLHFGWLVIVTAFADIAAPIIVLFVITQTEREAYLVDAQEEAVSTASGVVLGALLGIRHSAHGTLELAQAAMLRAGADGDIDGMISAAIPREAAVRYLTVNDICDRLGVPCHRDAPPRRRIARRIKDAYDAGGTGILRGEHGQGYVIPGTLYDELFGDWKNGRPPARISAPRSQPLPSRGVLTLAEPTPTAVTGELPASYQDVPQEGATPIR